MRYAPIAVLLCLLTPVAYTAEPPQLWLYQSTNLLVDKNVDELDTLWRRAAAAGYDHVQLNDSKFARLGEMPERYFRNAERVKRLAADLKLQIVPGVFSIGWSNDLLSHNPNLAEGQLVKDALFVVKDGEARLVPDPLVTIPKKPDWKDDTVTIESNIATVKATVGNSRFTYTLAVSPRRAYHVSVWVKTQEFTAEPEVKALAGKPAMMLHHNKLGTKRTQDWTLHHVVFNSGENDKVTLYFGVWGTAKGSLQWKDWKIEETGLVNVLRREGTPLTVSGYTEGKDFDRIEDPKLGGPKSSGNYDIWHEPPTIKTKLPDGTKLRVSWYHSAVIYGGSVCICLSDPETKKLLADNAKRVNDLFAPAGVMMNHDEIRILNSDAACRDRKLDAGEILADNAAYCVGLLKGKQVYAWSDMWDPNHNAHNNYYLVQGDLTGSWKGLDKSVTILNWNFGQRDKSLQWFAGRGHQQIIAGYYDGSVGQVKEWMKSAANVKGVVGYMYTTWENKYDDLEGFAKIVRQ